LFEVSGIYPATPGTAGVSEEDSLAHRLLKHLGLPTTPVVSQDDELPAKPEVGEASQEVASDESETSSGEFDSAEKSREVEASSTNEVLNAAPEGS
jgi:hypothetical protein